MGVDVGLFGGLADLGYVGGHDQFFDDVELLVVGGEHVGADGSFAVGAVIDLLNQLTNLIHFDHIIVYLFLLPRRHCNLVDFLSPETLFTSRSEFR